MRRIREIALCFVLMFGAMFGVPMRAEEIERLFSSIHRPRIVQVFKSPERDP